MNCPPAPCGGSSLSIMPAKIYPHFDEFLRFAQFYWREKDFPDRVDKYFRWFFTEGHHNPYQLTPAEQDHLRQSAVTMAKLIRDYQDIANSMLNWRCIYGNPPIPGE